MLNNDEDMLTFTGASEDDPKVLEWLADHQTELGKLAGDWFRVIRQSGEDVTELLHDGYPTACIGEYPFAYVGVFRAHVNVGFFYGASLADPDGLLQGTGKRMRHVKILPNKPLDEQVLETLIANAYSDIKYRLDS